MKSARTKKAAPAALTPSQKQRMIQLKELVAHHADRYHTHDSPEISDEAYDALVRELIELEQLIHIDSVTSADKKNAGKKRASKKGADRSPSQTVGGKILEGFEKTKHLVPQWSYDNVFGFDELVSWDERNRKILEKSQSAAVRAHAVTPFNYCCELKIDGLKIVLTYKGGKLITGATRGDGEVGEDITENIKMIKSIPHEIVDQRHLVVVGEVWMKKSDLKKINNERRARGEAEYANPRNLAAGTLRQLDTSIVASRDLQVYCYDIDVIGEVAAFDTHTEELTFLKRLGFSVNPHTRTVGDLKKVQQFVDDWIPHRNDEEYAVDGVVIKLDDVTLRGPLGYTAKSPRFGVAYKFPAEEVTTVVENIEIQVGRTGVLTPVAHVKPVLVAGSVVSRATLHNQDEIDRLDVRIGDTVILRKAGDIIPEILEVLLPLRPKKNQKFTLPKACPVCNALVTKKQGGTGAESVALYCTNRHCPAQSLENLIHYASKKAMNIVGLGEKIIEKLVSEGLVQTPVDIYRLSRGSLETLEKFGELSANNLLESIETSKNTTLQKFLFALGIHHIGEETADLIASSLEWKNNNELFDKLTSLTDADLIQIPGIGSTVAESFIGYMADPERYQVVKKLLEIVSIAPQTRAAVAQTKAGSLAGKTFVITGTLPTLGRDDARALVKQHGGKVASSVSKNTDYLLMGVDAGSKYDEAVRLGIAIIDEQTFMGMI